MDELWKSLIVQLPLVVVVGIALYVVYTDGKNDRAYMIALLQKQFIMIIELTGGKVADHDETLTKRP